MEKNISEKPYRSEYEIENMFIDELVKLNYEHVQIHSEQELIENFKIQFKKFNNIDFTEEELEEIYQRLNKNGSVFDKAKFLRTMDTVQNEDKTISEFTFIDQKDWSKNIFQVTNQIKMEGAKYTNRYDVTILINGLPLVQIELKNSTVQVEEAFNQIQRYKEDSMTGNLFDYVQLFIMSNENKTMYTANNRRISKQFAFEWKDFDNNTIGNLQEFTHLMLEQSMLIKYISNFIVLSKPLDEPGKLLAMRPYQVHAVNSIVQKFDNKGKKGYIWHTTGSGKTLTSYKVCELLSSRSEVDKVLFIVDRQDLDKQTTSEYQAFQKEGDEPIVQLERTKDLIKAMNNSTDKIIVTTIHKLEKAIKGNRLKTNKNCVLIFDECHRSQFGDMHYNIDAFFNEPYKFGFTGTPILKENRKADGQEFNTTEDVFGAHLHTYLINDAIEDKNVLGFAIDYKSVFNKKQNSSIEDEEVGSIDRKEVFHSGKYIKIVCEDIVNTYNRFTHNREFNAMLATNGIRNAVRYFNMLSGEEVDGYKLDNPVNLKLACVYSYTDNEGRGDNEFNSRLAMEKIINNYNATYENANYSLSTFSDYKKNVSKRMKRREVDLLIVSDMFLTGFDAKRLNTMYYDKEQSYHNLIQSLSRTNRIYNQSKDFGNIVCYRAEKMKKRVDDAIRTFSNKNAETNVLKRPYEEVLVDLNGKICELLKRYPTIDDLNNIKGDEARKEFIMLMRSINHELSSIGTYRAYRQDDLECTERQLEEYKAYYRDMYNRVRNAHGEQVSILNDIDFEINLISSVVIDYDYIKLLITDLDELSTDEEIEFEKEKIIKKFEDEPKLRSKKRLIEEFLYSYYSQTQDAVSQFDLFIEKRKNRKLFEFASERDLDFETLVKIKDEYSFTKEYRESQKVQDYVTKLTARVGAFSRGKINKEIENLIINMEEEI